jgi:hypothetical protein
MNSLKNLLLEYKDVLNGLIRTLMAYFQFGTTPN